MGPWEYRAGGSRLCRSVSQDCWAFLATWGEELARACVGGRCSPVLCSGTPRQSPLPGYQANLGCRCCLYTKANAAPAGELQNALRRWREPSYLRKGRCSSHLDTPVGVRPWRTLTLIMAIWWLASCRSSLNMHYLNHLDLPLSWL